MNIVLKAMAILSAPFVGLGVALYTALGEFFYTWYFFTVTWAIQGSPEWGIPDMPAMPPPPPPPTPITPTDDGPEWIPIEPKNVGNDRGCNCEQCRIGAALPPQCRRCSCRSLLDGAYDVVELWHTPSAGEAASPSQVEWKKKWLQDAKKWGVGPE